MPLGRGDSGLEEFVYLPSGSHPQGAGESDGAAGVVLVLVPPGRVELGKGVVPECIYGDEIGGESVKLDSFYIAKFEATHGQWAAMGGRPRPGNADPGAPLTMVAFAEAVELLDVHNLELPTEAQWEYAATFANLTSASLQDLRRCRGTAGGLAARVGGSCAQDVTEGGLYDFTGNVSEWTGDVYAAYGTGSLEEGSGLRLVLNGGFRAFRGGNFTRGRDCTIRAQFRDYGSGGAREYLGIRPVRRVLSEED